MPEEKEILTIVIPGANTSVLLNVRIGETDYQKVLENFSRSYKFMTKLSAEQLIKRMNEN
jgi:hypothetical protein